MEAAFRRVCQGDTSSLSDILNCIEAGQQVPTGKLRARTYTALATLLLREGLALCELPASGSALPSEEAFHALRILAVFGSRNAEEGHDVKSVLLSFGLQRCREMVLDAYLAPQSPQRRYAIMFVTMLIAVYGCSPQDFLKSATSLNVLSGSADPGGALPRHNDTIEAIEVSQLSPHYMSRGAAATAGCSVGFASLTPSTNPQPPPEASSSPSPPRRGSVENRSALLVSIPAMSEDLPLQPARRYRALPRKPSSTPYPVNPLYVGALLCEGSSGATATGEDADHEGDDGGRAPLASPSLAAEVLLTAQFPMPVVRFSAYYGVGCVPRLPTIDNLARLCEWRERKQQEHVSKSDAEASSSMPLFSERPDGWGTIPQTALQMRELNAPVNDDSPDPYLVRNAMTFVSPTSAATACHRRCLDCFLLEQYMQQGILLTWGSLAKGALGPHCQRHGQCTLESPSSITAFRDHVGSKVQVDDASPVSMSPTPEYLTGAPAEALSSRDTEIGLVGCKCSAKVSFTATLKAAVARGRSTADSLPVTQPKAQGLASPLQSCTSSEFQKVTSTTSTGALLAYAASPNDTNVAGYAYLPLPVNTPARVAQVACGLAVTYIVTVDGVLYSCGRAENGQLGTGSCGLRYAQAGVSEWQRVPFNESEHVNRIAAGTACAVALAGDSALYFWGHNVYGQCLTMPDASRVLTPVQLQADVYRVLDVCLGQFFGVLLFEDGVMGIWGIASMLGCRIGGKMLERSLAPDHCKCARQIVRVRLSEAGPMAAVRAGPWHALAISLKGTVYTWGVGRNGRLGHGTDSSEVEPRLVEELRSYFVVDASCSHAHSAVLTSTGTVYVFGENTEGQLGLRGREPRRLPTMLSLPLKAVSVSCAREHTCILLADGDVIACGSYRTCGIGLGYGSRLCAPVRILTNYVTLMLHSSHLQGAASVVRRRTALMVVGHSTTTEVSRVSSLVVRNNVRCAASGVGFLVVLSENNSLVAIGRGDCGQLGIGECMKPTGRDDVTIATTFSEVHIPPEVVIQHVRCGPDFVLALDDRGAIYGWGSNDHQKLCQPAGVAHVFSPARITAYPSGRVVQIVCGGTFVVALTADGNVLTHGEAMYCGLGPRSLPANNTGNDVPTPTRVAGLSDIVAVAAGLRHAVAMTMSCIVFAWGAGVLGDGRATNAPDSSFFTSITPTPVQVALSQTIRSIGCGPYNSFAISDEGELWVWGLNLFGECGVPTCRSSTKSGGGTAHSLGIGQRQDSEANAKHASVIKTPTAVARQVRDAAFTAEFGVVLFEDGQVRVSGRIWYAGQRYFLPSFHSTPQPPFSMATNDPWWRPSPQQLTRFGASLLNGGGSGASAIVAADAQRQQRHQGSTDTGGALENEDDESVPSNPGLLEIEKSARPPVDDRHRGRPRPPSLQRLQAMETGAMASSPTSARASKLTLHPTSLPSSPLKNGGCRSPLAPCGTPQNRFPYITSPRPGIDDVAVAHYRRDMMPEYSPPSLSKLISARPGRMRSPMTVVTAGGMDAGGDVRSSAVWDLYGVDEEAQPNMALAEAYPHGDELRSPEPGARLSCTKISSQVDACTRISPRRVSDGEMPASMQVGTPTVAQPCRAMSTTRSAPDSRSLSATPLRRDPPAAPAAGEKNTAASRAATAGRAAVRLPVHRPPPSQLTSCRRKVLTASAGSVPLTRSLSSPRPPSASDEDIFGIRCFAGWEQICVVIENNRPSVNEVSMAQTGLQVLLHQTGRPVRED
ncbi:hypothetical protein JKF63_04099 [Porcisia hertigi]|uniref:Uncharacterized protein n=1 Tax=Porcisia hertigi TaxID=2761500 RepID=A0A836L7Z3_9TRYP|nr:hypothetical protein JKF63_04099 [Porcisia hertigi]